MSNVRGMHIINFSPSTMYNFLLSTGSFTVMYQGLHILQSRFVTCHAEADKFFHLIDEVSITMSFLHKSCFENSVDPDQLASEKQADQDPHCFPFCLSINANNCNPAI